MNIINNLGSQCHTIKPQVSHTPNVPHLLQRCIIILQYNLQAHWYISTKLAFFQNSVTIKTRLLHSHLLENSRCHFLVSTELVTSQMLLQRPK